MMQRMRLISSIFRSSSNLSKEVEEIEKEKRKDHAFHILIEEKRRSMENTWNSNSK